MRWLRIIVLATATVLVLAMTAGSSVAQRVGVHDGAGDAARAIDVNHVVFKNAGRRMTSKAVFADLRKRAVRHVEWWLDTGSPGQAGFIARADRRGPEQPFRVSLMSVELYSDAPPQRVRCPALAMTWQAGGHWREFVRLRVPQGCLGQQAGRVRFRLVVSGNGHRETVPGTTGRSFDWTRWIARGAG